MTEQQTAGLLGLEAHQALEHIGHDITALRAYALALWIDRDEWMIMAINRRHEIEELQHDIGQRIVTEERLRDQMRRARQELVMTGITLEDLP